MPSYMLKTCKSPVHQFIPTHSISNQLPSRIYYSFQLFSKCIEPIGEKYDCFSSQLIIKMVNFEPNDKELQNLLQMNLSSSIMLQYFSNLDSSLVKQILPQILKNQCCSL